MSDQCYLYMPLASIIQGYECIEDREQDIRGLNGRPVVFSELASLDDLPERRTLRLISAKGNEYFLRIEDGTTTIIPNGKEDSRWIYGT